MDRLWFCFIFESHSTFSITLKIEIPFLISSKLLCSYRVNITHGRKKQRNLNVIKACSITLGELVCSNKAKKRAAFFTEDAGESRSFCTYQSKNDLPGIPRKPKWNRSIIWHTSNFLSNNVYLYRFPPKLQKVIYR